VRIEADEHVVDCFSFVPRRQSRTATTAGLRSRSRLPASSDARRLRLSAWSDSKAATPRLTARDRDVRLLPRKQASGRARGLVRSPRLLARPKPVARQHFRGHSGNRVLRVPLGFDRRLPPPDPRRHQVVHDVKDVWTRTSAVCRARLVYRTCRVRGDAALDVGGLAARLKSSPATLNPPRALAQGIRATWSLRSGGLSFQSPGRIL